MSSNLLKNLSIFCIVTVSIILATIVWPLIDLNFSNFTGAKGAITEQNYSTDADTLRYIVFIALPIIGLYFGLYLFKRDELRNFKELLSFPNENSYKVLRVNYISYIFIFFILIEFFSLNLPIHSVDAFHDGELFSVSKNSLLRNSFFIDTYTIHGFSDILYPIIFWKIFGFETIGAGRTFFLFLILLLKIFSIVLSYQLTKFSSVKNKELFFIFFSLILISMSEYGVPVNFSYFSYRDIFIILFLIFFSQIYLVNDRKLIPNIMIGVIPSIAFLMHIDTGAFLFILLFVHIFFLIINGKMIDITTIVISVIFSWLFLIVVLGLNEILNFFKNASTIILSMDYLHGIIYPEPFTSIGENKNGMRATRGLILQVTAGLFSLYYLVRKSKDFSNGGKIFFLFLFFLSFIMYKNALGRSDSFHIRMSNDLPILLNCFFLLNFLINKVEKKFNFFHYNYVKIISITIVLSLASFFQKIDFDNLKNYKKNFKKLVSLPNEHYIDSNKMEFVNSFKKLIKENGCLQNFTDDLILLYLIERPSCSKFVASWLASPQILQDEYIESLKLQKPNFIIYDSKYFKVDNIPINERLSKVNSYIMKNYKVSEDLNNFKILKIKD